MKPSAIERIQQTRRLLSSEGLDGMTLRVRRRAANWISPASSARLRVITDDLPRAAEMSSSGWQLPPRLPVTPGEPLDIAWVAIPPGEGAGGFTTLARAVSLLAQAGHRCTVYMLDPHGWSIDQHRRTVENWWPDLGAEVRDAADGIDDAHAIFATSWPTAYRVLTSPAKGVRFYFVQDFEPWFYPAGSEALLAEATYRFGFHGVTAGRWLAQLLRETYGMPADHFEFGCDLERYSIHPGIERTGVCFYARPSTPRRGFELGVATLELLAARHPEVDIHTYGEKIRGLPFATNHGVLAPADLNRLYNRCITGLALSASNVSLVPPEMLAAGCIPVVNDADYNRIVLDNPEVVYAPATPFDLVNAISALVERPSTERTEAAQAAAASVQSRSWADAGAAIENIVQAVVAGTATTKSPVAVS